MEIQIIWLRVNWDSSWLKWLPAELAGPDCADLCQHTCYLGWLDVVLLLGCRPCFVWFRLVVDVCGKWAPILVSWNYAQLLLGTTHFVVWVLFLGCHWTFLARNHLITLRLTSSVFTYFLHANFGTAFLAILI